MSDFSELREGRSCPFPHLFASFVVSMTPMVDGQRAFDARADLSRDLA
jgi:hypothetical protein